MSDLFTPEKRSGIMRKIGQKNTKPELIVRKLVHAMGYRYRLHVSTLPGKPDIVFPKYKKVIFVHGCYWHQHEGCNRATIPKTNVEFWTRKFRENMARDKKVSVELEALGWKVLTVWQCETKRGEIESLREVIKNFLEDEGIPLSTY
jgi:DNA mismatch endonuclease (patch repair protein)